MTTDGWFTDSLNAVADALHVLEEGLPVGETVDAMASRLAQGLAGVPVTSGSGDEESSFTADDLAILAAVETSLNNGRELAAWFEDARAADGFTEVFSLERTFNRPASSCGFFGEATLRGPGRIPVMGNLQEMFYDAPRVPPDMHVPAADWLQRQVREFVLRYFMRVSDFREPEAVAGEPPHTPPRLLEPLSWCQETGYEPRGFGFSQLYYKTRDGGVGKFPENQRHAIVDLREIGDVYEWIVLRVRIFDFAVRARPFGNSGLELNFGLDEESLLVVAPPFIVDRPGSSGEPGEFALGYAFMRNPMRGVLAYGPGQFDAAFETIRFTVGGTGEVRVEMVFVANRPTEIVSVTVDPIDWAFRLADLALFGIPSRALWPAKALAGLLPLRLGRFDPVYTYVALASLVTGGLARSVLCISREELDRRFLVQHFMQHYQTVTGSLLTWRQIPDWLDESALPAWVVEGVSL
jgi:hypothetical protein